MFGRLLRVRRPIVLAAVAGLPLALYLLTLSGGSYWLDAGEFVAASVSLGVAHPPGHPLTSLYGKLFSLLPLGSLAFRIALGQAVAAVLGAVLLFRACEATAVVLGVRSEALRLPIAVTGAWLAVLGYAVWFQAIRPEVYALQAVLLFLAMERLAIFHAGNAKDCRPLYGAALALGLGLANHHLMALFMFPALAWSAWCAVRQRGLRPLLLAAAFGLLALCTYVYLPLRAARAPLVNLGDPETPARFYWVVAAKIYARNVGAGAMQSLSERCGDVLVVIVEHMHGVFLLAALLGLYVALRRPDSRRMGVLWLLCAGVALGMRPWLGSPRGNPDAIGYMIPGLAALAVLASAGFAAAASLAADSPAVTRWLRAPMWLVAASVVALGSNRYFAAADLSSFHATDLFDEHRERGLPARSVVVATTPQTVFRHFELTATERVRPDVELLPLPFLRYPGVADAVVHEHPDLRALVEGFLATETVHASALAALATRRPVFTELDSHVPPSAFAAMLPMGLLYATVDPATARALQTPAAGLQRSVYQRVYQDLGAGAGEAETSRQLLWLHYMDALYYAAAGDRARAGVSLALATRLRPADSQLRALRAALANDAQSGPLDVRPFLAFGASPAPR
jgi:hypothetical protein